MGILLVLGLRIYPPTQYNDSEKSIWNNDIKIAIKQNKLAHKQYKEAGNQSVQNIHSSCVKLRPGKSTPQEYKDLEQNSDPWICNLCNNFNFSESFFDTSLDLSHSLHENSKVDEDMFDELRQL
jgi:hypothetical protein